MDLTELGQTGLVGWRQKVGDRLADAVADHTPLTADQARAAIGAAFFALSAYYVYGTLRRAAAQARDA